MLLISGKEKQMKIIRSVIWTGKALLLSLLAGCGGSSAPVHTVTVVGTSDLQGIMRAAPPEGNASRIVGGISRIATLIDGVKTEHPGAVVVTGGDDLMGVFFQTFDGKAVFSLLSQSGYDLMAFGNHEFDKRSGVLADALGSASFTPLCTDLNVTGTPLQGRCRPWEIREIDGVKVGFFSLMTEAFATITLERNVTLLSDNVTAARRAVSSLRAAGAQAVVALTHIGEAQDRKLAAEVPGIDLIFGSHSHGVTKTAVYVGKTMIVNGGEKGQYVLEVALPFRNGRVVSGGGKLTLHPVAEGVVSDADVNASLKAWVSKLPPETVLGTTARPWDLRTETLRTGESEVCDMINDLLRGQFGVDAVVNNAGAFRGKRIYPGGNITDRMLHEIDLFENDAFLFTLPGKYLKAVFEHSAAFYGGGGFLQVSGVRYTVDLTGRPQIVQDGQVVQTGERIIKLEILSDGKWTPVDPEASYRMLGNAYLVNGGDGYFWFKKYGSGFSDTYTTFYSIMASHLSKYGELTPPQADGRITVVR